MREEATRPHTETGEGSALVTLCADEPGVNEENLIELVVGDWCESLFGEVADELGMEKFLVCEDGGFMGVDDEEDPKMQEFMASEDGGFVWLEKGENLDVLEEVVQ